MNEMKITLMEQEALEAPDRVASQLAENQNLVKLISEKIPIDKLNLVVTCARGSSDHAATYAKYLFEIMLGIPVVSIGPSIGSIYEKPMKLKNSLFLVISQSGKSPDIVSCAKWAKNNGSFVVGLVNQEDTPLHEVADLVLPLHAGNEKSVAATKSYICSLTALAHIASEYKNDLKFREHLQELPNNLRHACTLDWEAASEVLSSTNDLLVIGRGMSYGITLEAALKFKETSSIHAEGFSSAELMHGPLALIKKDYPILVFTQNDQAKEGIEEIISTLLEKGAKVFVVDDQPRNDVVCLPNVPDLHPYLSRIVMIQRFYLLANNISLSKGFDPDKPTHLKKVTETK